MYGQFHHLAESRTCIDCGNALGSKDHKEECESPPPSNHEVLLMEIGLTPDKVRAIGMEMMRRVG